MDRADSRAGLHRHYPLHEHRHADDDAVGLLDPEHRRAVCEAADLGQQVFVADVRTLPSSASENRDRPLAGRMS